MNGDISVEGLEHDSLLPRFLTNKSGVHCRRLPQLQIVTVNKQKNKNLYTNTKRPLRFPKGNAEGVFLCQEVSVFDNQANLFKGQYSFELVKFCSLGEGQKVNCHQPVKK